MLGRYSSAIRAACANERSCGSVRGAISDDRPYRDLVDPLVSEAGTPPRPANEPTMAFQMWLGTQVPPFRAFPSPRQSGGPKGWLRRLHFMRPFAPCFGKLVAGAQVYLTDHEGLYQNPRLHPLSPTPKTHCFKPCKLQSDAVPKSTDSGLEYGA
jgi:hypothetical protein